MILNVNTRRQKHLNNTHLNITHLIHRNCCVQLQSLLVHFESPIFSNSIKVQAVSGGLQQLMQGCLSNIRGHSTNLSVAY